MYIHFVHVHVKIVFWSCAVATKSSRSTPKSVLIREKARMARAASYAVSGKENDPPVGEIQSDGEGEGVSAAGKMSPHDSSLSSSTGLTNGLDAVSII